MGVFKLNRIIFFIIFIVTQSIFAEQIFDNDSSTIKTDTITTENYIDDSVFSDEDDLVNHHNDLLKKFKDSEKNYEFTRKNPYTLSLVDYLDQNIEGKWIFANDGTTKFFTRSKNYLKNDEAIYEWDGPNFKNVIHGEGVLTRKLGNEVTSENVNAFFGSITSKDIIKLPHGLFIGEFHDLSLEDFGVFLDSLCIYIGNFKNSLPIDTTVNQYGNSWVCKEKWQKEHKYGHLKLTQNSKYEGFIKNEQPDGFGRIENSLETKNALFVNGKISGPFYITEEDVVSRGVQNEEKIIAVTEIINKDDYFSQKIWKNGSLKSVKTTEQINDNLQRIYKNTGDAIYEEYIFDGTLGDIYKGPVEGIFSQENLEEHVHFVGSLSYLSHKIIDGPCSIQFTSKDCIYQGWCSAGKKARLKEFQTGQKETTLSAENHNEEENRKSPFEYNYEKRNILEGIYENDRYIGSVWDENLINKIQHSMAESHIDIRKEPPKYHYRGRPYELLDFSIDETVKSSKLFDGSYSGGFDNDYSAKIEGNIRFYNVVTNGITFENKQPLVSQGTGTLMASNGTDTLLYVGDFSKGKFDGYGYLVLGDYFEYEGEFKDGKICGYGKLTAKKITIPNLDYIDKEIKSIRGVWNGLNELSQFFVIETIDGEIIDMVFEKGQTVPVSKSESVKNTIGNKSIAKLVRKHHGKITITLIGIGFGAGLFCGIISSSTAETSLFPCLAAVEGGVFALQSVVDGFVLYDRLKEECYGSELCKDNLLKEYAMDRFVDFGLTVFSVSTGGIAGSTAKTAKAGKTAKAAKATNDIAKTTKVIHTTKKISDSYIQIDKQICDKFGNIVLDLSKCGKNAFETAIKLIQKYGDDAIKATILIIEKNPGKLASALRYMDAKGIDGIHDVLKWQGAIPKWLTKEVIEVAEKIARSSLKESVDTIRKLPGIRLSTAQLDMIRQTPSSMEKLVKEMTGKEFRDGYLEFFIRLTKSNADQATELWNYSTKVRDFIKNNAIRPGKTHEWLMCENFMDFLTDPKWRKEGTYLAKALSVLVQKTDDVYIILEDGTKWTHTMEKFGNGTIHNKIREVVKNSNSAEELLVNLENMVRKDFPEEVYEKFANALADCFK